MRAKILEPSKKPTTRRLARTEISFVLLEVFLRGGARPVIWTDAPSDLKVMSVFQTPEDQHFERFSIIMESESFSPVYEGDKIPHVYFEYES